jgi:hypothetical protein
VEGLSRLDKGEKLSRRLREPSNAPVISNHEMTCADLLVVYLRGAENYARG